MHIMYTILIMNCVDRKYKVRTKMMKLEALHHLQILEVGDVFGTWICGNVFMIVHYSFWSSQEMKNSNNNFSSGHRSEERGKMDPARSRSRGKMDPALSRSDGSQFHVVYIVFISLVLDLLAFTLILPLLPSLLDYYASQPDVSRP